MVHSLKDVDPCPENSIMLEAFEWFSPPGGTFWINLKRLIPKLKAIGIDNIWIPPATKGGYSGSSGYDVYDLYDLGEFDQKGTIKTRWGSKKELQDLMKTCHENGIGVFYDVVIGHKVTADHTELVQAIQVSDDDRLHNVSDAYEIEAWTALNFEGRNGEYSSFKYNSSHFNGVDWNEKYRQMGVWRLKDKKWADDCDHEQGSYDMLLGSNVDLSNQEVREDLKNWIKWLSKELPYLTGLRIDAFKHMSQGFMHDYLKYIDEYLGKTSWFIVGEYWTFKLDVLLNVIKRLDDRISLFDFPLHQKFVEASRYEPTDLRTLYDDTLAAAKPSHAVTFVTSHDTQARGYVNKTINDQNAVSDDFIPIAYALTLLQANRGFPMVFWGDLLGTCGPFEENTPVKCRGQLPKLMLARKLFAYGRQVSYFDEKQTIGFTRLGDVSRSSGTGLAVLATICSGQVVKRMFVGLDHAGETWTDVLGWTSGTVEIDEYGSGVFACVANSVAVWVDAEARNRSLLDGLEFDTNVYPAEFESSPTGN